MKRIAIVFIILVIVAGGGFLTAAFQSGGVDATSLPGAKVQCADPACSVFVAEPWQSGQFLAMVGFILVNLLGAGITITVIFWLLSRQIAQVKGSGNKASGDEGEKSIEKA